VLPLVPAYLGYLGGQAAPRTPDAAEGAEQAPAGQERAGEQADPPRLTTFFHGLFFVLGFAAVFVVLGAAASGVGRLLFAFRGVLARIGGLVVVLFGLHTLGLLKIPFLYRDTRRKYRPRPGLGYASSALMGVFFGAGWCPCVGPTLGAILTLALNEATVGRGASLLLVYSLGLGVPFLLLALGVDRATTVLRRAKRMMQVINVASGLFLVAVGLALFFDQLGWLAQWGPLIDPGI
jgi:cytochrome c-type biogenesis protein